MSIINLHTLIPPKKRRRINSKGMLKPRKSCNINPKWFIFSSIKRSNNKDSGKKIFNGFLVSRDSTKKAICNSFKHPKIVTNRSAKKVSVNASSSKLENAKKPRHRIYKSFAVERSNHKASEIKGWSDSED